MLMAPVRSSSSSPSSTASTGRIFCLRSRDDPCLRQVSDADGASLVFIFIVVILCRLASPDALFWSS